MRVSASLTRLPDRPLESILSTAFLSIMGLGAGLAVALEGPVAAGIAAVAVFFAVAAIVIYRLEGTHSAYLAVDVPVFLILVATVRLGYSFGGGPRTAEELTQNPFDIFSVFSLACTGLAIALGLLALSQPHSRATERLTTRSVRLYAGYAFVVLLGLVVSVNPLLTGYRASEMLATLIVVAGALRTSGQAALRRIETIVFWYAVLMMASAWIGAVAFGGLIPVNSPIPVRLQGMVPHISSNTLGYLSVVVALWSTARLLRPNRPVDPRPMVSGLLVAFSLVTLIAAQYRTGYAMLAAGIAILLLVAGRKALASMAVVGMLVITFTGPGLFQEAQPYILRGEDSERASRLSGRVTYWSAALPVWQQSPIIGGGLQTASRLVVLDDLDTAKGSAQNLHSTWVEALVGTGLLGVTLLALSLLTAWLRALFRALGGAGRIVSAVILSALIVRSLTGGSIEGGGDTQLLFLTLAFGLRDGHIRSKYPAQSLPPPLSSAGFPKKPTD